MQPVFSFLRQLAQNNTRDWLHANRPAYDSAKKTFEEAINTLIISVAAHDPRVSGTTAKQSIFRLARDVRFSKNKMPYKLNFSASLSENGRKSPKAFYYLHIQPEASFMASGLYMVESATLKKIRQEIDYNADQLREILAEPKLKAAFGGLENFPEQDLKTVPRGYPKDHPEAPLLRRKSFILSKPLADDFFEQDSWIQEVADLYALTIPFNQWLNVVFEEEER